jgi:hypothetical protein
MRKPNKICVFKRGGKGSWVLRYRQEVNEGGQLKTVHRSLTLCPGSATRVDAYKLAEKESAKLEQSRPASADKVVSLGDYFAKVYLPFAESTLRHWTVKSYRVTWAKHFVSPACHAQTALRRANVRHIWMVARDRYNRPDRERRDTRVRHSKTPQISAVRRVHSCGKSGVPKRGKSGCGRDAACCYAAPRNRRLFLGTDTHHDRRTA